MTVADEGTAGGRRGDARGAELAARQKQFAAGVVASVKKVLVFEEWRAGEMVWLARLGGVEAAVMASVSREKLILAMGSTSYAYERGFSPSDPSLCHSKAEALARVEHYR